MTWGHKYGNRKPVAEYPLMNEYEGMQERLKTSYLEMTYDNDAWCAPVGMAWRTVRRERPDCILYRPDCYPPAVPGSYLAANVIFTTIFQRPYQTAFTAELPAEQAEYLQQTAQRFALRVCVAFTQNADRQACDCLDVLLADQPAVCGFVHIARLGVLFRVVVVKN